MKGKESRARGTQGPVGEGRRARRREQRRLSELKGPRRIAEYKGLRGQFPAPAPLQFSMESAVLTCPCFGQRWVQEQGLQFKPGGWDVLSGIRGGGEKAAVESTVNRWHSKCFTNPELSRLPITHVWSPGQHWHSPQGRDVKEGEDGGPAQEPLLTRAPGPWGDTSLLSFKLPFGGGRGPEDSAPLSCSPPSPQCPHQDQVHSGCSANGHLVNE